MITQMCSCKGQAEEGSKEEDFGERNKDTGGQRCMVQTFLNFSPGGIELGNPETFQDGVESS